MASDQERASEPVDAEDVASDFFDDFAKDDFIEGLSVIDSWDDGEKKRSTPRIDATAVESVKDLRELIDEDRKREVSTRSHDKNKKRNEFYESIRKKIGSEKDDLRDYIKPGSRRDPSKTNEAIRRDKEEKVKEYLDKCLDGSEELRPPGTELDDFFNENKSGEKRKVVASEEHETRERQKWEPHPKRRSPRWSPKRGRRNSRSPRRSPRKQSPRRSSPQRKFRRFSPQHRSQRRSPVRRSPIRRSPNRRSPNRRSPVRRSPRRHSPRRSPKWAPQTRSPFRGSRRSRSRSPGKKDSFLYPNASLNPTYRSTEAQYATATPNYPNMVMPAEYPPGQVYQQPIYYPAGYGGPGYDYGAQMPGMPAPQPVPAPVINPMPPLAQNIAAPVNPAPAMVPPPAQAAPVPVISANQAANLTPYDALAQLVADGKLSKEDYLKLAPNKGASHAADNKARVAVLNRCNQIFSRLSNLSLPNRLMMNNNLMDIHELKSLAPKFCSPLKRQATVDFHFTKVNETSVAARNKQLIETVLTTIGLDNIIPKSKKKIQKGMKDAATQTTKLCCDVCEIRESTRFNEVGTTIDPEHFSVSTHTQVVDQDLINSKAIFNPSGSVSDAATISIAHLTPAQLVSQLAARAKTLKQTEPMQPPQYRRNPPYDYDSRGQQYQNNYNNYRY